MRKLVRRVHKWSAFAVMLALLLNIGVWQPLLARADGAGDDVTELMQNFTATVKQGDKDIPEGGTFDGTKPVAVEIKFNLPLFWSEAFVKNGDYVQFALSTKFPKPENPMDVMGAIDGKSVKIGTLSFDYTGDTQTTTAKIVFDDTESGVEDGVFENPAFDILDNCSISLSLNYGGTNDSDEDKTESVTIASKTYNASLPAPAKAYTLKKTGEADLATGEIAWEATITGTRGENATPLDLAGLTFSDDLSNVGEYVADSFTVGGVSAAPQVDGQALTYTFPAGATSPQTITFKTKIPDNKYYVQTEQTITNTARLVNDADATLAEGTGKAEFTPEWITKTGKASQGSGGTYDPKNRTITWTITANTYGATLNKAVIHDTLANELTLKSAEWQTKTGDSWSTPASSIKPNDKGEYAIGDINTPILLTLVTGVPDSDVETGTITYSNTASISWENQPGIKTQPVDVGIGYNAITKKGTGYDPATAIVSWAVTADARGQSIADMKVYDLLVYGDTKPAWGGLHADSKTLLNTQLGIDSQDKWNSLNASVKQKYVDSSFNGTGLAITVKTLKDSSGQAVADLLMITSSQSNDGALEINKTHTFTFDTQLMDPKVFAKNPEFTVNNTACLYSGNAKLNAATGTQKCRGNVVSKDALPVADAAAIDDALVAIMSFDVWQASVNNAAATNDKCFNYVDKTVVYRLHINANGMNMTDVATKIGKALEEPAVTLTDALPEGWTLKPFAGDRDFLLFEGTGVPSTGKVTATTQVTNLDGVIALNKTDDSKPVFTFPKMEKSYVLLLKAGPTEPTYRKYFEENGDVSPKNNASLTVNSWAVTQAAEQTAKITSTVLAKTVDTRQDGVLTWTVTYNPYNLAHEDVVLTDTLPIGVDLPADSTGALDFTKITGKKLTLHPNGSLTNPELVYPIESVVSYDAHTRILTFALPDKRVAYQFTYVTDITGDAGTSVSNHVSLSTATAIPVQAQHSYRIQNSDATASANRAGWIQLTKTGENGATLSGAEFTVFAQDGVTPIRTGTTNASGALTLRGLPNGTYILRETKAPDNYNLSLTEYPLVVENAKARLNGQTGADANKLTVPNIKTGTVGDLRLAKTVAGNAGETDRAFSFTIALTLPSGQTAPTDGYPYVGAGGAADGTLTSGDNTVSLRHGESITATNLPRGTGYVVTEEDYRADGYVTVSVNAENEIAADETAEVVFTNTKNVTPPSPDPIKPDPVDPEPPINGGGSPPKPKPNTPADNPTETPVETPTETPAETPAEAPEEAPVDDPAADPAEPPAETPAQPTQDAGAPSDAPVVQRGRAASPDPSAAGSPEVFVLVDENGVPLGTYTRTEIDGEWVYVDEDGVPLAGWNTPPTGAQAPRTGDQTPLALLFILTVSALAGLCALRRTGRRKVK